MVSEKVVAAFEAGRTFAEGGTADTVISAYRTHVAANAARLGS